MIFEPYISVATSLFKAWRANKKYTRAAITVGAVFLALALLIKIPFINDSLGEPFADGLAAALAGCGGLIGLAVVAYQKFLEQEERLDKIAQVEERALEHPEKPQLAWDLARTKLESYLDRNLAQVRSIYWLTLIVMLCGFAFILYGVYEAFQDPKKLSVSIVASASGVLISFIGGSLLVIYRSILSQSKDYVTVLERINAVGMAVQVIGSIPESGQDLRNKTTAELAKQLLSLYGSKPPTVRKSIARTAEN